MPALVHGSDHALEGFPANQLREVMAARWHVGETATFAAQPQRSSKIVGGIGVSGGQ
jgi:hypothetical protein